MNLPVPGIWQRRSASGVWADTRYIPVCNHVFLIMTNPSYLFIIYEGEKMGCWIVYTVFRSDHIFSLMCDDFELSSIP